MFSGHKQRLNIEKVIPQTWISRILGFEEIGFSYSNNKIYLHLNEGKKLEIDILKLEVSQIYVEGIFFSKFIFDTSSGAQSFKYLPKGTAREVYKWIRQLWYDKKVLPSANEVSAEVGLVLGQEGYLRSSKFQHIHDLATSVSQNFKKLLPEDTIEKQHMDDFSLLNDLASWGEKELETHRGNYLKDKKKEFANYFDTIENNPLTESQRDACIIDEDNNLVLAGAGTGKTSTMVGRAGFLIKNGQATPNQILMLAFTNKAAEEMQERLKEKLGVGEVVACTFHKLGKDIITRVEGAQPSISPLAEDDKLLAKHVNDWFEEKMQETAYKQMVIEYFGYYLYPQANPFDFNSEGEYYDYILANGVRTLKGEEVKGLGECLIANHLFKLGIEYKYEEQYKHLTRSLDFRQYKPDFYLPEYDIYIEHFGIDEKGNTASYVNREKYHRGMNWKREIHKTHNTTLIETYHYEYTKNTLLELLKTKLEKAGVIFNPLSPPSPEDILNKLREFGAISTFAELLSELMKRYKACHFEEDQVATLISEASDPGRMSAALKLLEPISESYEKELSQKDEIDFDDMIGRAIGYVKEGKFSANWRYIMVDEFQDISEPRARLVKALRDSVEDCSLFCVGDDWQSIYRFTGSDIAFTTEFADKFGATKVTMLDKTFRFNNSICDVASEFILKNPSQVQKALTTYLKVEKPAVSILRESCKSPLEEVLQKVLKKVYSRADKHSTVYLLGRFNHDLPSDSIMRKLNQNYSDLSISKMTIHSSKGKEADFVILLNLQSGENGFPSQKVTHPLLESLLPRAESFAHAEERRLFYVGLTRAKHRVYLICDMSEASDFVVELIQESYPVELDEFETSIVQKFFQAIRCIKCKTGQMVQRKGKEGVFYGCNYYPLCDNTENGCGKCGNPMERQERFRVCINPECNFRIPTCRDCDADMIERDGPHGKFWGCSNYRHNEPVSCTYTEKLLVSE